MSAPVAVPAVVAAPAKPSRLAALRAWLALDLLDDRYPVLHGLRVIAIVSVVQYHLTWFSWAEQGVHIEQSFAERSLTIFFGMDLFFILSGFLIGMILLRSLEKAGTLDLRRFYLRRILRTFPPYWIVLTLLAVTYPLTQAHRDHLWMEYAYLTNFATLGREGVIMFWGWSLAFEEQFYLVVPALMFALYKMPSDRVRVIALVALWASALVVRLVYFYAEAPWTDGELYAAIYFRAYTRFDTLVAGILLALVHVRWREPIGRWLEHPFHRALIAMPLMACLWFLLEPLTFGYESLHLFRIFAWGTLTSITWLCVLLLMLHGDGWVHRALSKPIWRSLATLGYGVYLVHIPILDHVIVPLTQEAERRELSLAWVWPVGLVTVMVASFAAAYVMHLLIEKPSMKLRDALTA